MFRSVLSLAVYLMSAGDIISIHKLLVRSLAQ